MTLPPRTKSDILGAEVMHDAENPAPLCDLRHMDNEHQPAPGILQPGMQAGGSGRRRAGADPKTESPEG